ncbi:uncharacterized protein TNCT_19061 [Trichonephila clavata]|uniref:C2H2-type domain-containing protein n=1 Tax=Trichonephila clavata TaxID=2740835 RepID=A0A8X6LSG9_TRICU|nr:uncharacterized protein TNCT_19061 [Trichonephila clavata]
MAHGLELRMQDMLEYRKNEVVQEEHENNEMVQEDMNPVYISKNIRSYDEVHIIQSWIASINHPQNSAVEYLTLLRRTLLFMFSSKWDSSIYQKDLLSAFKFHYKKFSTITDNTTEVYNALLAVAESPWRNRFFQWKELFEGKVTLTDRKVKEYFDHEPEEIVVARVHSLIAQGKIYPAMCLAKTSFMYHSRIAKSFRHHRLPSDSSECTTVAGHSSIDWYIFILQKRHSLDLLVNEIKELKCHEGIEIMYRLWRNPQNRKFCYAVLQIFILQDLVQDSTFCCTEKLFKIFCMYHKDQQSNLREISDCTHKIISVHAPTSAHFYLFVDVAWKQFGMKYLDLYIELYVRGLTIDLNHLENKRSLEEKEDVVCLETHIASVFSKFSTLFINFYDEVARECMFSAFSLRPTKETLYILLKLNKVVLYNNKRQQKSLSIGNDLSSNCVCGLRCIGHCRAVLNNYSFSHPLLIKGIGNVSHYLVRDLVSVLESARSISFQYNFFDWRCNTPDLETYLKVFNQKTNNLRERTPDIERVASIESSEDTGLLFEDQKDSVENQVQSVQSLIKRKINSVNKNEISLLDVGANIEIQSDDSVSKRIKFNKPAEMQVKTPTNFFQPPKMLEDSFEDFIRQTINSNIPKGQHAVYTLPGKPMNQPEDNSFFDKNQQQQVNIHPSILTGFEKHENVSFKSFFENKTEQHQRNYENHQSHLTNPVKNQVQTSATSTQDNSRKTVVVAPETIPLLKNNHFYEHQNIHNSVFKNTNPYSNLPNEVHSKGNGMMGRGKNRNVEEAINLNCNKNYEQEEHIQKYHRQTSPFVSSQPPPKSLSKTLSAVLPTTCQTQNINNLTPYESKKSVFLDRNSVIRHTMQVKGKSFQIPNQLPISVKASKMEEVKDLRQDDVPGKSTSRINHAMNANLAIPQKSYNSIDLSSYPPPSSSSSSHNNSQLTIISNINSSPMIKTPQWTTTLHNHGKTHFSTKFAANGISSTKAYHKPHKRHMISEINLEKKQRINKSKIGNLEQNFLEVTQSNQQWATANMLNYSNNQPHKEHLLSSNEPSREVTVPVRNSSSDQFLQHSTNSSCTTSSNSNSMRNYCNSEQQNDNFLSFTKHSLKVSELVKSSVSSQHLQQHFANNLCSSSQEISNEGNYSSNQHNENSSFNSSKHELKGNNQLYSCANSQPLEPHSSSDFSITPLKTSEPPWYANVYPKAITCSTASFSPVNNTKVVSSSISSSADNKDSISSVLNSCKYTNSAIVPSEQTPHSLLKSRLTSSHSTQSYSCMETYSSSNSNISTHVKTSSGNLECSQKLLSIKNFSELPSDVSSSSLFSSSSVTTSSLTNPVAQFNSSLPSNHALSRDKRNDIYQEKNYVTSSQSLNIHNANANIFSRPCCSPLEVNPCDSCSTSAKFNPQQFLTKNETTNVQSSQANNQVSGNECFQLSTNMFQLNEMEDPHTMCNFCSFSYPTSLIELHMEKVHGHKRNCVQAEISYKEILNSKEYNASDYNLQNNNEISVENSNHDVCSTILDAENSQNTDQLFSSIFDILKDDHSMYKNKDENVLEISENTHPLNLYPNESPCDISQSGSLSEMLKQVDFSRNVSPNLSAICENNILDCNRQSDMNKEPEKSWFNDFGLDPLSNSDSIENKKSNFEMTGYETLELEKSSSKDVGSNPDRDDLKNVLGKQNFKSLECFEQMPKTDERCLKQNIKYFDPNVSQFENEGSSQSIFQQQLPVSNSVFNEELNSDVNLLQHTDAYHSHTSSDLSDMQNINDTYSQNKLITMKNSNSETSFMNDTSNLMNASQIFDFDPYSSDNVSKEVYKPLQKGRSKDISSIGVKAKFKNIESDSNKNKTKSENSQVDKKNLASKKSQCKYCGKLLTVLYMKQHILHQHPGHPYVPENSSTNLNSKQHAVFSSTSDHKNSNVSVPALLQEDIDTNTCLSPSDALHDVTVNFQSLDHGNNNERVGSNHTVSKDGNEAQKHGLKFKIGDKLSSLSFKKDKNGTKVAKGIHYENTLEIEKCHLCLKSFSNKSFFIKHMRNFHNLKDFSECDVQQNGKTPLNSLSHEILCSGTEFKTDSFKAYPFSEETSISNSMGNNVSNFSNMNVPKLGNHKIKESDEFHHLIDNHNTDDKSYTILKSKAEQLFSSSNQSDKVCLQSDSKDLNLVIGVKKVKKNVPKNHECYICDKKFSYEKNLSKHMQSIHSVNFNKYDPSSKNTSQKLELLDKMTSSDHDESFSFSINENDQNMQNNEKCNSSLISEKGTPIMIENNMSLHLKQPGSEELCQKDAELVHEHSHSYLSVTPTSKCETISFISNKKTISVPSEYSKNHDDDILNCVPELEKKSLNPNATQHSEGSNEVYPISVSNPDCNVVKNMPKNGKIPTTKLRMKKCYSCVFCGKEFTTLNRFKKHVQIYHPHCVSSDVTSQNLESKDKSPVCVENAELFQHEENTQSSKEIACQSVRGVSIKSPICSNSVINDDFKNEFISPLVADQSDVIKNKNLNNEGENSDFQDTIGSVNEIGKETSSSSCYESNPCSSVTEQQFSDKCNILEYISDENFSSTVGFKGDSDSSFKSRILSEILEDFERMNEPSNEISGNQSANISEKICPSNVCEVKTVNKQCNNKTNTTKSVMPKKYKCPLCLKEMHKSYAKRHASKYHPTEFEKNPLNNNKNSILKRNAVIENETDIKSSLTSSKLLEEKKAENYACSDENIIGESSPEMLPSIDKNRNNVSIKNFLSDKTSENLFLNFEPLDNLNNSLTEGFQKEGVVQENTGENIDFLKESQGETIVFEKEYFTSHVGNQSISKSSIESSASSIQNMHSFPQNKENSNVTSNKDMAESLNSNQSVLPPPQQQNIVASSAALPIEKQVDVTTDDLKMTNYGNHDKQSNFLKEAELHLSHQNQLKTINSIATFNVKEIIKDNDKIQISENNLSVVCDSDEKGVSKLAPDYELHSPDIHAKQDKAFENTDELKDDHQRLCFSDIVHNDQASNTARCSSEKFLSVCSPGVVKVLKTDSFCIPDTSSRNMACLSPKILSCEFSKDDENSHDLVDFNISSSDVLPTLSVNEASSLNFLIKDYQCNDAFDLSTENFNDLSDDKIKMTAVESQPSPNIFVGDNEKDEDSEIARKCVVSVGENFLALNNPVFSCMVTSVEEHSIKNIQDSVNPSVPDLQCDINSDKNSIFQLKSSSQQVVKQTLDDIVNLVCCDEKTVVNFDSKNQTDEKCEKLNLNPALEKFEASFDSLITKALDESSLNTTQDCNENVQTLNENSVVNSLNASNITSKKCRLCNEMFDSMKDLSQHLKLIHSVPVLKRQISTLQINSNVEGVEKLSPPQLSLQGNYDSDSTSTSSETTPLKSSERKLSINSSFAEALALEDEHTESVENIQVSSGISLHQTSPKYKCKEPSVVTQSTLYDSKTNKKAAISSIKKGKQITELKVETFSNEHVPSSNVECLVSDTSSNPSDESLSANTTTLPKCIIRVCKDEQNSVFYEIDNSKSFPSENVIEKQKSVSTVLENTKCNSEKIVALKQRVKRSSAKNKKAFFCSRRTKRGVKKTFYQNYPNSLETNKLRSESKFLKKSNSNNVFTTPKKKNKSKKDYSDALTFKKPADIDPFLTDHKEPIVHKSKKDYSNPLTFKNPKDIDPLVIDHKQPIIRKSKRDYNNPLTFKKPKDIDPFVVDHKRPMVHKNKKNFSNPLAFKNPKDIDPFVIDHKQPIVNKNKNDYNNPLTFKNPKDIDPLVIDHKQPIIRKSKRDYNNPLTFKKPKDIDPFVIDHKQPIVNKNKKDYNNPLTSRNPKDIDPFVVDHKQPMVHKNKKNYSNPLTFKNPKDIDPFVIDHKQPIVNKNKKDYNNPLTFKKPADIDPFLTDHKEPIVHKSKKDYSNPLTFKNPKDIDPLVIDHKQPIIRKSKRDYKNPLTFKNPKDIDPFVVDHKKPIVHKNKKNYSNPLTFKNPKDIDPFVIDHKHAIVNKNKKDYNNPLTFKNPKDIDPLVIDHKQPIIRKSKRDYNNPLTFKKPKDIDPFVIDHKQPIVNKNKKDYNNPLTSRNPKDIDPFVVDHKQPMVHKNNYSNPLTFKNPKDIDQFLTDHKQPMVHLTRIKNTSENGKSESIDEIQSCSSANYSEIVAKKPLVKLERLIFTPDMKIGNVQIRKKEISVIIPKLPKIGKITDKTLLSKVSSQSTNCQSECVTKNLRTLPVIKECCVLLKKLPL